VVGTWDRAYPGGGEPEREPSPFVMVGTWDLAYPGGGQPEREPSPFVQRRRCLGVEPAASRLGRGLGRTPMVVSQIGSRRRLSKEGVWVWDWIDGLGLDRRFCWVDGWKGLLG